MSSEGSPIANENIVKRVTDLPVVNVGVVHAKSLYDKYLQDTVSTVNTIACSGLSVVEENCPSIKKQPMELKDDCLKTVAQLPATVYAAVSPTVPVDVARERVAAVTMTSRRWATELALTFLSLIDYADTMVDNYMAADEDIHSFNKEHDYDSVSGPERLLLILQKVNRGIQANALNKFEQLCASMSLALVHVKKVSVAQNIPDIIDGIKLSADTLVLSGVRAWVSLMTRMSDAAKTRIMPLAEQTVSVANDYVHDLKEEVDAADSLLGYTSRKATQYGAQGLASANHLGNQGLSAASSYTAMFVQRVQTMAHAPVNIVNELATMGHGLLLFVMQRTARIPTVRALIVRANEAIEKEKSM